VCLSQKLYVAEDRESARARCLAASDLVYCRRSYAVPLMTGMSVLCVMMRLEKFTILLSDSLQSFLVLSDACSSLMLTMSSSLRSFKQRLPSPTLSLFREINYSCSIVVLRCFRPNSITLSISRADSRAGLRPASELDSVMEFGLSGAIQLASSSRTSSPAGRRPAANRSATRFGL